MKIKELLSLIDLVYKKYKTSKPYIVGGSVRDKVLGRLKELNDLDITTGDKSIHLLADELSRFLSKKYQLTSKTMDDGHTSIFFGNLKIDFSSNFNVQNIDEYLLDMGITNPTNMQREAFSRDFTCNSLLMDFDLKNIQDPTGRGLTDIKNKIIRTCLSPDVSLDCKRIVRAIYLAAKLDFTIDNDIIDYVSQMPELIVDCKKKYIIEKLDVALKHNPQKTIDYISKMNLWKFMPISEAMAPYYKRYIEGVK